MSKVKPQFFLALLSLCLLILCCKRETSLEGVFPGNGTDTTGPVDTTGPIDTTDLPNLDTPATYTLHTSDNGACSNALVQGSYVSGTDLDDSHTITLEVEVSSPGQWEITTNTVDGIFFSSAGVFTAKGLQTVTLSGTGTPGETGFVIVPVSVGNSSCGVAVSVTD
jgi:hypothetical protein